MNSKPNTLADVEAILLAEGYPQRLATDLRFQRAMFPVLRDRWTHENEAPASSLEPLEAVRYFTGVTNERVERFAETWGLGLLAQPGNSYHLRIDRFRGWAADNGCFAAKWDADKWWAWLQKLTAEASRRSVVRRCAFAVAPDVVADAEATLERSRPWLSKIRALGLPVAFVAQDGSEADGMIPWGEFDVLFLGGSTEWKLDPERAGAVTAEANRRGVPVHMGRVNSRKRLALSEAWGCKSADGTFLAFGGPKQLDRLAVWIKAVDPNGDDKAALWAWQNDPGRAAELRAGWEAYQGRRRAQAAAYRRQEALRAAPTSALTQAPLPLELAEKRCPRAIFSLDSRAAAV